MSINSEVFTGVPAITSLLLSACFNSVGVLNERTREECNFPALDSGFVSHLGGAAS